MPYYTVVFKHPISNYCEEDPDPVESFEEVVQMAKDKIESIMLNAAGKLVVSNELLSQDKESFEVSFAFQNGNDTGARIYVKQLRYSEGANALGDGVTGLMGI